MKRRAFLFLTGILAFCILFEYGEGIAQPYTLTINEQGGGSGTVTSSPSGINCPGDCSEGYGAGKRVTLRAKPGSDSYFASWSGGGCSGTKSCSVIIDSDVTVTATFEKRVPKLAVSANQLDFGAVEVGKKAQQYLTLSNVGTADLHVAISVTGDFFSIKGKSNVTIRPGKSYKLTVFFQPQPDYPEIDNEGADLGSDSPVLLEGSQPIGYRATIVISGDDGKDIIVTGTAYVDPEDLVYNIDPDLKLVFHYQDEDSDQLNKQTVKGFVIMDFYGKQKTRGREEACYTGQGYVTVDIDNEIIYPSKITTVKGSDDLLALIAARRTKSYMIIDTVSIEGNVLAQLCDEDQHGKVCKPVEWPYRYIYENEGGDHLKIPLCDGCEAIESGECYTDPQLEICNKFILRIYSFQ